MLIGSKSDGRIDVDNTVISLISITSHYLFALATKYAEVSSVAPIEYLAFIWTGLLGYFFLKEIPSIMIILGGIIIIVSGIFLVHVENKSIYPISSTKN